MKWVKKTSLGAGTGKWDIFYLEGLWKRDLEKRWRRERAADPTGCISAVSLGFLRRKREDLGGNGCQRKAEGGGV